MGAGQGSRRARPTSAAPVAHTMSVRGRPSRTSARWSQAGTASVKPMAPIDEMKPISPGENPRSARMTEMKG